MTDETTEQVKRIPNPTGKGGFKDNPENINPGGKPKNQESFTYWMNTFKNMTTDVFLMWEQNTPQEQRSVASDLAYARVVKARTDLQEFREVANRTEGMPKESATLEVRGKMIIFKPERNEE